MSALACLSGCGGSTDPEGPLVGRIDDAVSAVEEFYGEPQQFVEVTATSELVSVIVAADDPAEQLFWSVEGGLTEPVEVGSIDRPTFDARSIALDPERILGRLREELPNSEIVDLAVTGDGAGGAIYDARLRSAQGGTLLVLLAADGRILGVQGE